MMYNPQLETFLRVADAGSFNKAAEELFITPPALTEAGKSIYRDAQYVVQYCRDSVVRAKNAAEEGDKMLAGLVRKV